MVIEKRIKLVGSKGEHELVALFDSGATYSCIDRELALTLGMVEPLPSPLHLRTAEKERSGGSVMIPSRVRPDEGAHER